MTLSISVSAVMIFIEAETGTQGSMPMLIGSGEGAFNGSFIYGIENGIGAHEDDSERISYTFEIPEAGNYYIWFRLMGQGDPHNSFFVRINGQGFDQETGEMDGWYAFDMWEPSEGYEYSDANPFLPALENHKDPDWIYNPHWHWIPLSYRDHTVDPPVRHNLVTQNFTAGMHTLELRTRETETYLDKIIITNDLSFDPRAISGDPEAHFAAIAAEAETAADVPVVVDTAPVSTVTPASSPRTNDNILIYVLTFVLASTAVALLRRRRAYTYK